MEHQFHTEHTPVLLPSVLDTLQPKRGDRIVDATLGGGGYTRALLERVGETGAVLAIDWDGEAITRFLAHTAQDPFLSHAIEAKRLILYHASYAELLNVLTAIGWEKVDGIVADLGLSSDQLGDPRRGLSFQSDGPLDMRMNSKETVTAADIVNGWSKEALTDLFRTYADEGEAERIAQAIVLERKKGRIETTFALARLVRGNVVLARRHGKLHPATKVFQALRMAVNSERQALEGFLESLETALAPHGRAVIVTFHSGEDALVKRVFQQKSRADHPSYRLVVKKPITPTLTEKRSNPRARSAKLRAVEKI